MNETRLNTVLQLRAFLDGTLEVQFQAIGNDAQRYDFIAAVLNRFVYRRLRRVDKGVVMRYLERTTGYSRQQLTRLISSMFLIPSPQPSPSGEGEKTMPVEEGQGLWRCTRNFKYVWIAFSSQRVSLPEPGREEPCPERHGTLTAPGPPGLS